LRPVQQKLNDALQTKPVAEQEMFLTARIQRHYKYGQYIFRPYRWFMSFSGASSIKCDLFRGSDRKSHGNHIGSAA
jgi:hypothetical protein